jgi:hypothetical protein
MTTTTITEEIELFCKVSASRYANNLLQGGYTSQGEQLESRDRRTESNSRERESIREDYRERPNKRHIWCQKYLNLVTHSLMELSSS